MGGGGGWHFALDLLFSSAARRLLANRHSLPFLSGGGGGTEVLAVTPGGLQNTVPWAAPELPIPRLKEGKPPRVLLPVQPLIADATWQNADGGRGKGSWVGLGQGLSWSSSSHVSCCLPCGTGLGTGAPGHPVARPAGLLTAPRPRGGRGRARGRGTPPCRCVPWEGRTRKRAGGGPMVCTALRISPSARNRTNATAM